MKISSAQKKLDSTLQAAKNATAPTAAKLENAVHNTVALTPMRSNTASTVAAMMSQRTRPLTGTVSSSGHL